MRDQHPFQLRELGRSFGAPGAPCVGLNFLHMAPRWASDPASSLYVERFLERLGLTGRYRFRISDDPDVVFFSVYQERRDRWARRRLRWERRLRRLRDDGRQDGFDPPSRRFSFPRVAGSFARIFFTIENVRPRLRHCELALGFGYEEDVGSPRYLRVPIYRFCGSEASMALLRAPAAAVAGTVEPRRFCNFVYRHDVPVRNALFDRLDAYRRVDAPSVCRNNMPRPRSLAGPAGDGLDDPKLQFLEQYRFTIACENECARGYTTEKLVMPMLAGSVPVYYGNPDVARDFNPRSFIHLSREEWRLPVDRRLDLLVERVREADRDPGLYARYRSEPRVSDEQWQRLDSGAFAARFGELIRALPRRPDRVRPEGVVARA